MGMRAQLEDVVPRVREFLSSQGCLGLDARTSRGYVLIERRSGGRSGYGGAVARLTALGPDAFGLSFQRPEGGWDAMLVVDTLEAVVADVTAAVGIDVLGL